MKRGAGGMEEVSLIGFKVSVVECEKYFQLGLVDDAVYL